MTYNDGVFGARRFRNGRPVSLGCERRNLTDYATSRDAFELRSFVQELEGKLPAPEARHVCSNRTRPSDAREERDVVGAVCGNRRQRPIKPASAVHKKPMVVRRQIILKGVDPRCDLASAERSGGEPDQSSWPDYGQRIGYRGEALQFSGSTANIGNGIGVGSGIGSTILSIIGIRRQHGPQASVGKVPDMLAPLFARQAAWNSYYPPEVLEYLRSAPPGDGSRIDQLMAEWRQAGRLGSAGDPKNDRKLVRLTSSLDDKTKLSIGDLADRTAMLADVSGRVALMKRDLAELVRSLRADRGCGPK